MIKNILQSLSGLLTKLPTLRGLSIVNTAALNTETQFPDLKEFPSILSGAIPLNLKSIERNKPLSELLSQVTPYSQKIIEFNKLVDAIYIDRSGYPLADKDDRLVWEALSLLNEILDLYWDDFSLKAKVVLLSRLEKCKNTRQLAISSLKDFIKNPFRKFGVSVYTFVRASRAVYQYFASVDPTKESIIQAQQERLEVLNSFLAVVRRIFEKDGHLLEEHRFEISKFANDIQSHYAPKRTPEETAAGLNKIDDFIKYKRKIWESMSAEDRKISDAQFEILDDYLNR